MTKAFLAVEGGNAAASSRIHHTVDQLAEQVTTALTRRLPGGGTVHIEDVQDQVELALMRAGEHKVARDYVLYREARARERAEKAAAAAPVEQHGLNVTLADGSTRPLDTERLARLVDEAARGLDGVDAEAILKDSLRNLFDGVKEADVGQSLVMSARAMIEREPAYSQAAARLLLDIMRREALGLLDMAVGVETQADMQERYADYFAPTSNAPATWNCSTSSSAASTWPASARRCGPSATCSSPIWACRPSTTATSSTPPAASASSCRRPSSCASRWAWPSTRSTAKSAPSSSTSCCRRSTS
jgi:hypothetical protein